MAPMNAESKGPDDSPSAPLSAPPPAKRSPGSDSPVIHEYDGIQECDNQLPRWWLYCLYTTIVFAVGYWFYFQVFRVAPLPLAEYERDQAALRAVEAERLKHAGTVTPEMLTKLSKDDATLKQGRETYLQTCSACHAATGGGGIGPNLTDPFWIHGGAPDKIYGTVKDGFLAKGMPAWGPQLGEERVRAVTAFVLTLKGTNVAGGKPPQGDKEL